MKPKRKKRPLSPNHVLPPPAPKGHKRSVGNKGGGRPGVYRTAFCEVARVLRSNGKTINDIADALKVTPETIVDWRKRFPNFSLALEQGREAMVDNVERSLYERAIGYRHPDIDIRTVSEGQGMGSHIVQTPIVKYYPPDTAAAKFYLANLRHNVWQERVEQTLANPDGSAIAPITVTLVGGELPQAREQQPLEAAPVEPGE